MKKQKPQKGRRSPTCTVELRDRCDQAPVSLCQALCWVPGAQRWAGKMSQYERTWRVNSFPFSSCLLSTIIRQTVDYVCTVAWEKIRIGEVWVSQVNKDSKWPLKGGTAWGKPRCRKRAWGIDGRGQLGGDRCHSRCFCRSRGEGGTLTQNLAEIPLLGYHHPAGPIGTYQNQTTQPRSLQIVFRESPGSRCPWLGK